MAIPMVYSDVIFDNIKISASKDLWRSGDLAGTYAARSIYLDITGAGFVLSIKGKISKDAQLVDIDYLQINTGKTEPVLHGDITVTWGTNRQYVIINPPPFVRLEAIGAGTLTVYGSFSTEAYSQGASIAAPTGLQEVAQLDPEMLQTSSHLVVDGEDVDELNRLPVDIPDGVRVRIEGSVKVSSKLYVTPWTELPGIGTGAAYAGTAAAPESLGIMGQNNADINGRTLPKRGIILAMKLLDRDNDTLAASIYLSDARFVAAADNAAFTISARDLESWIDTVAFPTMTNLVAVKADRVLDADIPFHLPTQTLFWQFYTTGTPNIASGATPLVKFFILGLDEPDE